LTTLLACALLEASNRRNIPQIRYHPQLGLTEEQVMNRFVWGSLVTLSIGLTPVSAQQLGVYQPSRPPISPYLNLNRGGNSAINYYGLVRPQIDTTRALQNLQYQVQTNAANAALPQTTTDATTVLPSTTGHPVMFLNSSHFFPTTGRTGTTGGVGSGGVNPFFPASTTGIVRR
jgi:hypothetical protein